MRKMAIAVVVSGGELRKVFRRRIGLPSRDPANHMAGDKFGEAKSLLFSAGCVCQAALKLLFRWRCEECAGSIALWASNSS